MRVDRGAGRCLRRESEAGMRDRDLRALDAIVRCYISFHTQWGRNRVTSRKGPASLHFGK